YERDRGRASRREDWKSELLPCLGRGSSTVREQASEGAVDINLDRTRDPERPSWIRHVPHPERQNIDGAGGRRDGLLYAFASIRVNSGQVEPLHAFLRREREAGLIEGPADDRNLGALGTDDRPTRDRRSARKGRIKSHRDDVRFETAVGDDGAGICSGADRA